MNIQAFERMHTLACIWELFNVLLPPVCCPCCCVSLHVSARCLFAAGYGSQWCNEHFVHAKGMKKAQEVRQQLIDIMKMQKMHVSSAGTR